MACSCVVVVLGSKFRIQLVTTDILCFVLHYTALFTFLRQVTLSYFIGFVCVVCCIGICADRIVLIEGRELTMGCYDVMSSPC